MQDKSIRLGVDDSQLKNVGRTAKSIVDEMIRSSRQYSTSSKEVLRDIEEQIKAIERKNKLTLEGKKAEIDSEKRRIALQKDAMMYEARAISDPTKRAAAITGVTSTYQLGKQGVSSQEYSLRQETEERKKQTQELRNIIDEIKTTSRNEIKADREGVEKTIRSDKALNKLGLDTDANAQQSLKRTIQRGEIGDIGRGEVEERANFSQYGRKGGALLNRGGSALLQKNDAYIAAGALASIPIIGQVLSAVVGQRLGEGEKAETSIKGSALSSFGGYWSGDKRWEDIYGSGYNKMGLTPTDVLNRRNDLLKTTGRGIGGQELRQLSGAEQFIGAGSVNQIASINRYGGGNMASVLQILEGNQRNMARLTENISAYVSTSNRSLQIGSNINESQMAKTIMGISAATGQSGIGLQQTSSAIQGLGQTGNPLVRSLMMRAFRQSNPNASLFDIQAMMENPLANFEKGGGQFFENIKGMTGGGEMYKQVLYSVFGGQLSRTRINEIIDSGGDFTKIQSESKKAKGGMDWAKGAEIATSVNQVDTAGKASDKQKEGKAMLEVIAEINEVIKDLADAAKKSSPATLEYYETQSRIHGSWGNLFAKQEKHLEKISRNTDSNK